VFGVIANRYIKSKVLLVILGLIGVAILFTFAGISDRASGGAHEAGIDESAMGRIYAWKAAWQMALANPLTGVGLNNFTLNFYFYTEHWTGMNKAVHSTWFGILAESGFPGLISFIAMVTVSGLSVWRTQNHPQSKDLPLAMRTMNFALLAGLAGFCVSGSFLTQGYTWPIYIMVAFVAATTRYAKLQFKDEVAIEASSQQVRALPMWHPKRLQGAKQ
jgi:O-antigen ligase